MKYGSTLKKPARHSKLRSQNFFLHIMIIMKGKYNNTVKVMLLEYYFNIN